MSDNAPPPGLGTPSLQRQNTDVMLFKSGKSASSPPPPPSALSSSDTEEEDEGNGQPLGSAVAAGRGFLAEVKEGTASPGTLNRALLQRQRTTDDAHGSMSDMAFQGTEPLTAQQLVSMRRAGAGVPSPDGEHIVFTVKELTRGGVEESLYDESADISNPKLCSSFTTRLYLFELSGGSPEAARRASEAATPSASSTRPGQYMQPRRLTNAPNKADTDPVWLDEGTVAFLSNRSGTRQVWTINIFGGEARQLSRFPLGVGNLRFCRSRSFLLFSARVYPGSSMAETAERDAKVAARKSNFHVYSKLPVRAWDEWCDDKRQHVFLQQVIKAHGKWSVDPDYSYQDILEHVAFADHDSPVPPFGGAEQFAVSPSGNEVAFTSRRDVSSAAAWTTNTDVFVVSLTLDENADAGGQRAPLYTLSKPVSITPDNDGYDGSPLYSPNGKFIAYTSMQRAGFEADRNRLMIYTRATHETKELLPADWDCSVREFVWGLDSSYVIVSVEQEGRVRLFRCSLAAPQRPECFAATGTCSGVALVPHSNACIYSHNTLSSPTDLVLHDFGSGFTDPLTRLNDVRTARLKLSQATELWFKGARGENVHAWFLPPSDVDRTRSKAYPLACFIHGGPQGAWTDNWHYRWNPQTLATHGFGVVCINFHGSTGYGQAFTDSISGEWGTLPFEDIMKGCDATLEQFPWLDPERQVALGASYGGFMINWINGHTNRFKCLVNHDGVFNQTVMYFATEELFFPEWEFKGTPWENPKLYDTFSPHKYVDKWQTPTLIIHGGRDYRVVDVEGIGAFTALQRRGIESKLLFFPDENHWVLSPANSIVWHAQVLEWVQKFTSA